MKIPNKISLALVAAFVVVAALMQMPLQTFAIHVAIALGMLAFTFGLFWLNAFGGGDAKLMAAGALWMGPDHIVEYVAYVTIFGGVLAVVILGYRKYLPVNPLELPEWARRLHTHGGGIPYGMAIASAALMLFPATAIFLALAA